MDFRKTVDILITDELKEILEVIKSQSLVATLLLMKTHFEDCLVESPVNFISISKDGENISYLTPDRMVNEDGELMSSDELWSSRKRVHIKPGSFVGKVFKGISAKEVEIFSNLFRAEARKEPFKFSVVRGKDIDKYYLYEKYASENGSLGASCMKHNGCQPFFKLYTENSDIVSMLIMLDEDGYLKGRVLLWDFDSYKIMDRIYTVDDEKLPLHFKKWATKNSYLYKSEQNWYNTLYFENMCTEKKELYIELTLPKMSFEYLPYLDTFKFLDTTTYKLYNYLPKVETRIIRILCATNGSTYEGRHLVFDDIEKVYRYRGEAIHITYCNIFTTERSAFWSSINELYILKDHAIYDEEIGEYIFNEEYDNLNNKEAIEYRRKRIGKIDLGTESKIKSRLMDYMGNHPLGNYYNVAANGNATDNDGMATQTEAGGVGIDANDGAQARPGNPYTRYMADWVNIARLHDTNLPEPTDGSEHLEVMPAEINDDVEISDVRLIDSTSALFNL